MLADYIITHLHFERFRDIEGVLLNCVTQI